MARAEITVNGVTYRQGDEIGKSVGEIHDHAPAGTIVTLRKDRVYVYDPNLYEEGDHYLLVDRYPGSVNWLTITRV